MEKLLIIDDDVQLTELVDEFLSSKKYKTIVKHNPLVALDFLEKNKVNLIILDIMLPEMDGFQVLQKIRNKISITFPIIRIPILHISSMENKKLWLF